MVHLTDSGIFKDTSQLVVHHNSLRDVFAQFCHRARLGGQLEVMDLGLIALLVGWQTS